MPHFTSIISIRDCIYVKQVEACDVEAALRQSIAALPFGDEESLIDTELKWLQDVASGGISVTLIPVKYCVNTWLWLEGSRYEPQYTIYCVQTDIRKTA